MVGCEPVSDRNHFYIKRSLLLLPYVDWTPWKARVQMKLGDINKSPLLVGMVRFHFSHIEFDLFGGTGT